MEDFYLSQALFRTQEILDNFTNERSMQARLNLKRIVQWIAMRINLDL